MVGTNTFGAAPSVLLCTPTAFEGLGMRVWMAVPCRRGMALAEGLWSCGFWGSHYFLELGQCTLFVKPFSHRLTPLEPKWGANCSLVSPLPLFQSNKRCRFRNFWNHGIWQCHFLVASEDQFVPVIPGWGWHFRDAACCPAAFWPSLQCTSMNMTVWALMMHCFAAGA